PPRPPPPPPPPPSPFLLLLLRPSSPGLHRRPRGPPRRAPQAAPLAEAPARGGWPAMTARVGRHGCQAAAGAAGARRALCLLALAHALAGASAQAPKPLWGKDLAQGGKTRGPAPKKRPDFSALAAKMGKASKPSGKPMKDGDRQKQPPPGSQLKGPLKSGSWKDKGKARPPEDAQPWGAAAKKGFGKPSKLLAQDMKRKMMEAKKGGAGKKFKSHQDVSDMKRRAMGKKPPLKGLPKLPPKRLNPFNGKKAASSIVFINEAPDAKDVDIFWVKSKKPPWPPLPGRKPEDVVQVRCRFGRRSGKAVQTAEELKNDLQVRGEFNITVRTDWAPIGSGHFLELVKHGFFNGTSIFRAVKGFLRGRLGTSWWAAGAQEQPRRPPGGQ
ncbi:unnamed protein product, partial [Prorocentrum cordatum]